MNLRILLAIALLGLASPRLLAAQQPPAQRNSEIRYGRNAAVGTSVPINGIQLYYETYGEGTPLLLIHGNGGSIRSLSAQIRFFTPHYRVIVADSRGHGKSGLGEGRLTYEQMAEDLQALLDKLAVERTYVLGWSDGGIIGLLMAIKHPAKVQKLAIMGANLEPEGAYDWARAWATNQDQHAKKMIDQGNTSSDWKRERQHMDLLLNQPHIPLADLHRISAPTLVMAGDKDVIRTEHTVAIFEALPHAHLCIFPGATHLIPAQDPETFNATVDRFFKQPYTRPDTRDIFQ